LLATRCDSNRGRRAGTPQAPHKGHIRFAKRICA